jgi:phosphoribosylformylglycinamidine (FGAM) synthase-like enzyme
MSNKCTLLYNTVNKFVKTFIFRRLFFTRVVKHKGEILKKAVEKSQVPVTRIAKAIKKSRGTLYNWYEEKNLPLEAFIAVGGVINYDFSKEIPELRASGISEQLDYKQKYLEVVEENNRLLKEILKYRKTSK